MEECIKLNLPKVGVKTKTEPADTSCDSLDTIQIPEYKANRSDIK